MSPTMKHLNTIYAGLTGLVLMTPPSIGSAQPSLTVEAPAAHNKVKLIEPIPVPSYQPIEQLQTVPPPVPVYSGSIQDIIRQAAVEFGVDPNYLLHIAQCESTFNPRASNGTHFGLFQFLPSTYAAYAPSAGAGADYWDATNNARTAAYMFAHGQAHQWECK